MLFVSSLIFCFLMQNGKAISVYDIFDNQIFTNFLTNEESRFFVKDECKNDIVNLMTSFYNLEIWAVKMLDSSGKLGSGVLSGNIKMLGHYDQCVTQESRDLTAQYCLATLHVNPLPQAKRNKQLQQLIDVATLGRAEQEMIKEEDRPNPDMMPSLSTIQLGVCVPSSCTASDVQTILKSSFQIFRNSSELEILATVKHRDCSSSFSGIPWSNFDVAFILFLIILVTFTMVATFLDNRKTKNMNLGFNGQVIDLFSITRNWDRLLNTKNPGTFSCLNGIRVISTIIIVLSHKVVYFMQEPSLNKNIIDKMISNIWNMPLANNLISVDTFFLMSGLLRGYGLLQDYQNHRSNFVASLWKRYLRLTPCAAVMIGFYITFAPRLGSGPYWYTVASKGTRDTCTQNWMYNLLYVNNYVNNNIHCLGQTWYLATDTQLFILAPLLIYPVWRWPSNAMKIFTSTIFTGILINFTYVYRNSALPTLLPSGSLVKYLEYQSYMHFPTHHRFAVYILGLSLGYVLFKIKGKHVQLSKTSLILGWTLCLSAMYEVTFGSYRLFQHNYKYEVLEMSIFGALHRLAWAAAIAWIVFACHTGYGGWINRILSAQIFQPLSTLSYSIFLTHFVVLMISTGKIRSSNYVDEYDLIRMVIGDICVTLIASTFLHIFIEAPVMEMINKMKNTKNDSENTKNGKDSSVFTSILKQLSARASSILKIKQT